VCVGTAETALATFIGKQRVKQLVLIAVTAMVLLICSLQHLYAQSDAASVGHAQPLTLTTDQARDSVQWLVNLAIHQMPKTYSGDDDWGDTKKVWAGVHVKREGLELKTHRRFKEVRHGRWVRYELALPDEFSSGVSADVTDPIRIERVELSSDNRWQVTGTVLAPMKFDCRVERWNLGFQWYSVNIEGRLRVELKFAASFAAHADYSEVPPAIVVDPIVDSAELRLEHFEVDRISKIGGDVAEELGEVLEKIIRDKWLQKENSRLADRLNKAINKNREKLKFSWTAWFSQ
jgi:hypothetical protein